MTNPERVDKIWRQVVARCNHLTQQEQREVRRAAKLAKDLRFNPPAKGFFAKRK
jgi:hypothetical protein